MKKKCTQNRIISRKINKYIKRKGSITVEASFILPLILFVIVFIICLAFYLYDGCFMKKTCYLALEKALGVKGSLYDGYGESEVSLLIKKKAEDSIKALDGSLIGPWSFDSSVFCDGDKVKVELEGGMEFFGPFIEEEKNNGSFDLELEESRHNETDYIRDLKKRGVGFCFSDR